MAPAHMVSFPSSMLRVNFRLRINSRLTPVSSTGQSMSGGVQAGKVGKQAGEQVCKRARRAATALPLDSRVKHGNDGCVCKREA